MTSHVDEDGTRPQPLVSYIAEGEARAGHRENCAVASWPSKSGRVVAFGHMVSEGPRLLHCPLHGRNPPERVAAKYHRQCTPTQSLSPHVFRSAHASSKVMLHTSLAGNDERLADALRAQLGRVQRAITVNFALLLLQSISSEMDEQRFPQLFSQLCYTQVGGFL